MSRPQFVVLKDDEQKVEEEEEEEEKGSKFKISSKNTSQNPDGLEETAPKNPFSIQEDDQLVKTEDFDADHHKEEKSVETSVSSTESAEKPCLLVGTSTTTEIADDDEGFRTPTSSDHKIPAITHCPPAPRKPRPNPSTSSTSKRKVSSPTVRRSLNLDLATEVESMFPPTTIQEERDDDNNVDTESKIKRARIDDHQSSE